MDFLDELFDFAGGYLFDLVFIIPIILVIIFMQKASKNKYLKWTTFIPGIILFTISILLWMLTITLFFTQNASTFMPELGSIILWLFRIGSLVISLIASFITYLMFRMALNATKRHQRNSQHELNKYPPKQKNFDYDNDPFDQQSKRNPWDV